MAFHSRLKSIQNELLGQEVSKLREETGYSVQFWRDVHLKVVFPAVFKSLAGNYRIPDHMRDAVSDASFVSAIYEWCQKDFGDTLFDPLRFRGASWTGTLFDPGGHGTGSVGPFQAYAKKAYEAIYASGELRKFLREGDWKGASRINSHLAGAPRPIGDRQIPHARPVDPEAMMLQRALSDYETMTAPMISFIGKIALTMSFARDLTNDMNKGLGAEVFKSAFPRSALAWIILRSESTADSRSEYRAYVKDGFLNAKVGGAVPLTNGKTYESYLHRILPVMLVMGIILQTSSVKKTPG